LCRHFRLGFEAKHGNFLTIAPGGSCYVHCCAATTNDDDALAALRLFTEINVFEVGCALDHPGLRVIELWQSFRHAGARGNKDRREFRAQVFEVGVRTYRSARPGLDAEIEKPLNLSVENVLWKTIWRNTISQHATEFRLRLEKRDRITHPAQMKGRGQPCRTTTDDRYCFRPRNLRLGE
jgi:hypothetical protein